MKAELDRLRPRAARQGLAVLSGDLRGFKVPAARPATPAAGPRPAGRPPGRGAARPAPAGGAAAGEAPKKKRRRRSRSGRPAAPDATSPVTDP
jgi:hypothetical protein